MISRQDIGAIRGLSALYSHDLNCRQLTLLQHVAQHPTIEAARLTTEAKIAKITMHHNRETIVFSVSQLSTGK